MTVGNAQAPAERALQPLFAVRPMLRSRAFFGQLAQFQAGVFRVLDALA